MANREQDEERRDERREDERQDERREDRGDERRMYHEERHTVDYTGPVTRLVGVGGAVGAVVLLGFYLQGVGMAEEFSTIAVIAVVFSLGYWADKRPDRLERRAGPFWRIASAVRESRKDIREYAYARPLRVAITLSVVYGIVIVLLKSALVALLAGLYSWQLAAAIGAALGAAVVAPSFFRDVWGRVSEGPQDYANYRRERQEEREADDGDDGEYEGYEDDDDEEYQEEEEENAR